MGIFQQTKYLLRKNFHIKKRNKRETLQEIIVPLYWMAILFLVKLAVRRDQLPAINEKQIPSFAVSPPALPGGTSQNSSKPIVGYVTNNIVSAQSVMDVLRSYPGVTFMKFNNSDSMVDFRRENRKNMNFETGIEFGKGRNEGLSYTIRSDKNSIPSGDLKLTGLGQCHDLKDLKNKFKCPANGYISFGIASLQASIDAAITMVEAGLPDYTVPNITAKMMPKEVFTPSVEGFSTTVSIYLVIAFTPYITVLLINLVQEKENKMKELMRIAGMSDVAYWLSWIITYAIIILISVLILNAIAVPGGVFGKSNFIVMVILFYLYGLSLISFAMMLTPFFKNAKTAGFLATIITIIFGVIPIASDIASSGKWALSLFSPTAFGFGLRQAVTIPEGLHFNNLSSGGVFPAVNVIVMLIVDTLLYFLLALYFDAVIPAEYGQRRPPNFIFLPSFWKSICSGVKQSGYVMKQLSDVEQQHSEDIEEVPAEMHELKALSIHNLRKVYHGKEEVVAVDGVSLDIYEGQVTALLGHNGAGKTTLIAMLTGMVPPSGGSALVYGMEITDPNQMAAIRQNIGVCHQQNVLFDFMNVREHLELYCGLRGITEEALDATVRSLVKEIDLADQEDTLSKDLSGGQKRKLCVGISLVGNPKVVILDEPTSGMDPYSRRAMWSLLQEKCKDRVVLLTTHFMDEADILADYKAVLSKGKVRCAGTSLFLKTRFGIGYHLNMALADDCDTDRLLDVIQSKVQGAGIIRHHGREMAFSLPMDEVSKFSQLFRTLEEHNDTTDVCTAPLLGVASYGVSMTTLEEVFLQLEDTNENELEDSNETQTSNVSETGEGKRQYLDVDTRTTEDGSSKMSGSTNALHATGVELNNAEIVNHTEKPMQRSMQQLLGLLKIRLLMTIRVPVKMFFMVLVPPILLVVGLVIAKTGRSSDASSTPQPLHVKPDLYLKPASSESYATLAVLQNSTGHVIDYIMEYFAAYKVGTQLVSSISDIMNSSSRSLWNLGFDIQEFPNQLNLSQSKPNVTSTFVMRYNDTTVHSVPLGVNVIGTLLHMNALKSQGKTPYPLETTILAFPGTEAKLSYDNTAFVSILLIGMSLTIIPGGFSIEVVSLRQTKIRHLLRVSGVSSLIYWLQFFIADALLFLAPLVLMLILIPAIGVVSLTPSAAMGTVVLAVLLYLPAGILFAYVISFPFDKWDTCQQVTPTVFNMGALFPFIAVALVDMIANSDTAIIIHYVCVALIPPYPVIGALYYIDRVYRFAAIEAAIMSRGESVDVHVKSSQYFTWTRHNGIPAALIAPVVHTILFGLLVYYLDQRSVGAASTLCSCSSNTRGNSVDHKRSLRHSSSRVKTPEHQDEEVKREKEMIIAKDNVSIEESALSVVVKGLWKKFKSSNKIKTVVKDLYFGVEKGEVFGLLGPNGAGKTTTLNMITADVHPTQGKVFVAGYDVSKHPFDAFQHMGFCPQVDALWEVISLEEHLEVYAKIRGVPSSQIKTVVNHYMSALKVAEHAKKRAKDLSGGTKRKVSFAMAMLGNPDLLLLDEPSTGLDPAARRFLWNTITKNVHGNRGAILTTHSMEEADALCSRVGIMVKGQLKCLGSTQRLKSTYGSGYTLEIKLGQARDSASSTADLMTKLDDYVKQLLPGATQSEVFGGRVTYKLPRDDVAALSTVFDALEKGKQVIGVEEYSFSQSTLEQVFLEFAKEQDDDRTGSDEEANQETNEVDRDELLV